MAYLTNLTPSSSLQGHIPFELWYSRKPLLSHLHEIGCCTFVLIPTVTPKTYAQSCPCVFIRYSPHLKAYWLWDHALGHVFDLFHVLFIKHLDEVPTDLLPGMMITLTPDSPPSWDTASMPPAPNHPAPPLCTPTYPPIIPLPPSESPQDNCTDNRTTNNTIINTITTIQNDSNPPPMIPPSHLPTISSSNNTIPTPTLCRSLRAQFSSAQEVTNNGLQPNSCLTNAISDSVASTTCACTT